MKNYYTKRYQGAFSFSKENRNIDNSESLCDSLWNSAKQLINLKFLAFVLLIVLANHLFAQESLYYNYYPDKIYHTKWRQSGHLYYHTQNNSDQLTNEFAQAINRSDYLDHEFKLKQILALNGSSYINRLSKGALGFWLRTPKYNWYIGMDFQQVLDGRIDEDLTKLMLMGNGPYAGKHLEFQETDYMNLYFNRLKFGMSKTIIKDKSEHTFSGILAFTVGQNYNYTELSSGSAFTQGEGEYLDLSIVGETQMSDTVWGNMFTFAGYGASLDLDYTYWEKNKFFVSLGLKNLGFINWSRAPFQSTADTSIHFSGVDENGNNDIPADFSESTLRNLIFKDVDGSSFSKMLPLNFHISAGKFISQSKFYVGFNTVFYPSLHYKYRAELFFTWNIKYAVRVSPMIAYSSFSKINIGLAAETTLWKKLSIRAGSSYLNTSFDKESPLGQGFFLSLVFRD